MSLHQTTSLDQAAFRAAMDEHFGELGGCVGLMVQDLGTGNTLTHNHTELFPTASTMKVPVLYEVYRQADAGLLDLKSRVTLRAVDRVPGSGVLQALDEELQPTVRDLSELMITVSDNYATDLLLAMIGKDNLAKTLHDLGLEQTSLPMTIREMLSSMVALDPADPATTYELLNQRVRQGPWDREGLAYAEDPRNDISSPADMVRLLSHIETSHGLSVASREGAIRILKNQNFSTIIPARLPDGMGIEVAHKTGSLKGVRNDVGIVYSPQISYVIAFMSKGMDDAAEAVVQMAKASRWVWDHLAEDSSAS